MNGQDQGAFARTKTQGHNDYTPKSVFTANSRDSLFSIPTPPGYPDILGGWFSEKTTLYEGEVCPISLKLYFPTELPTTYHGLSLPNIQKTNCLAWKFEKPNRFDKSQVYFNDISYLSASFNTTVSGLAPGSAILGPASVRLIAQQVVIDERLGSRYVHIPLELNIPAAKLVILPLPNNKPPEFNGAIGNFSIRSYAQKTNFKADEPVELLLQIRGKGNLESLQAPSLNDPAWKVIDSSKITRGKERKKLYGAVIFRQLLRPADHSITPTEIPSYTFSYFDPEKKSYYTVKTKPIAIQVQAKENTQSSQSSEPEKTASLTDESSDILGFIEGKKNTPFLLPTYWHGIPILLAFLIISFPIKRKIKVLRTRVSDKEKELSELLKESNEIIFYREAGRFIEQNLKRGSGNPLKPHQHELNDILGKRDDICFQRDADTDRQINRKEKDKIIQLLKTCSKLTLILFVALSVSKTEASNEFLKSGHYQKALEQYKKNYPDPEAAPANILYNMGNCHYRLKQLGLAALKWKQALLQNPSHQEARQNLLFVQHEENASAPGYEEWQKKVSYFPPSFYQIVFQVSLWLIFLTLLARICLRPSGWKKSICISLFLISIVTSTLSYLAGYYYPDDHLFASANQQAIILKPTKIYPEPHFSKDATLELASTSLVKIIAERGPWIYIKTFNKTEGWVRNQSLKKVVESPIF